MWTPGTDSRADLARLTMLASYLYVLISNLYEAEDRHQSRQLKPSLGDSALSSQQAATGRTVAASWRIFSKFGGEDPQPQSHLQAPLGEAISLPLNKAMPAGLTDLPLHQCWGWMSNSLLGNPALSLVKDSKFGHPHRISDSCLN